MTLISKEQQEYVDGLRSEYAYYADAAREFDRLADQIEELGALYSKEALKGAVNQLRDSRDQSLTMKNSIKSQLKESEGWQQRRQER